MAHRHLAQEARERREGEHATGRDPDVRVPHGAEVALPRGPTVFGFASVDDTIELKGKHLAHVPDDDLDLREGVEEAAVEEAQDVEADFLMPIPGIDTERISDRWWVVALEPRRPVFGRTDGMEIDRNVELLGSREQGPVGFVVVEAALVVIVDQGADKAKLLNTASQLVGGGRGIRDRDRGPATKAGRMLLDGCR